MPRAGPRAAPRHRLEPARDLLDRHHRAMRLQDHVLGGGAHENLFDLRTPLDPDDNFIHLLFPGELNQILPRRHAAYQEVGFARDAFIVEQGLGPLQTPLGIIDGLLFNAVAMGDKPHHTPEGMTEILVARFLKAVKRRESKAENLLAYSQEAAAPRKPEQAELSLEERKLGS